MPLSHCVAGMVGSINAPLVGNTYEKFRQNAASIGTDHSKVGVCIIYLEGYLESYASYE